MTRISPILLLRSFVGLALGAIAAALAVSLLSWISSGFRSTYPDSFPGICACAVIIFALAVPFGFLAHAILYKQKWRWLWAYCLAAALEAAAFYGIGAIWVGIKLFDIQLLTVILPSAALCAATAWYVRLPGQELQPQ